MENDFFKRIDNSNASTNRRNELHHFIIQNPEYLSELCSIALNTNYKNHYKGVWILEMIAEKQTELLSPYINAICDAFSKIKNDSAIRGMSRVALFLGTSTKIALTESQEEKIIGKSNDARIATQNTRAATIRLHSPALQPTTL